MYINIVINNKDNTFYIEETKKKPVKRGAALNTLNKMEKVLANNNLKYAPGRDDKFSKMNKERLATYFSNTSSVIRSGYLKKFEKVNPLRKKVGDYRKKMNSLYEKIQAHQPAKLKALSPSFSTLHSDLQKEIASYLDPADANVVSRLDKKGKGVGDLHFLQKAQRCGYEGKDVAEAKRYLAELHREMKQLLGSNSIYLPTWVVVRYEKQIDLEKTLENLDKLSVEDIYHIILSKKYYKDSYNRPRSFPNLQPILLRKMDVIFATKPPPVNNFLNLRFDHYSPYYETAIYAACKFNNPELVRLLLKHGASPQGAPLNSAASEGHVEVMKLLLDAGANINQTYYGYTPLRWAIRRNDLSATKFLIEEGARVYPLDHTWGGGAKIQNLLREEYLRQNPPPANP